jgi:hypothetical protein
MKNILLTTLLFISFATKAFAAAGPPLLTDDPGTPGNKNIELNIAFTSETSKSDKHFEAPIVDFNYGLGDHLQLKYEVPWILTKKGDADQQSGLDRSIAGVKWRFLDKEQAGFAMSTYPQVTFKTPVSEKTRNPDADDGREVLLPIEAEEYHGDWEFNQELGYRFLQGSNVNRFTYGAAVTYNIREGFLLLAELHGDSLRDFSDNDLLTNIGGEYLLSHSMTLLASIGQSLMHLQGEEKPFLSYVGMQFHF